MTSRAASRHVILWGLDLKDALSTIRGEHHIVRRCRLWPRFKKTGGQIAFSTRNGSHCRFDYCELRLYTDQEVFDLYGETWDVAYGACIRGMGSGPDGTLMTHVVIERCLFVGGPTRNDYHKPNMEHIETVPDVGDSRVPIYWRILYCYGDNLPTKQTIIDDKGDTVEIGHCTFYSSSGRGAVQCRNGSNCHYYGITGNCNVRLMRGPNNIAHDLELGAGYKCQLMAGQTPWNEYINKSPQAFRCGFGNVRGGCKIIVGEQFGTKYDQPALYCWIEGDVPDGGITYKLHRRTTVSPQVTRFTPVTPVVLTAADVGPHAPWKGVSPFMDEL